MINGSYLQIYKINCYFCVINHKNIRMTENKYSFRNEIKFGKQKEKEEKAQKDFNRNKYGLYLAAVVFFFVLLITLQGIVINSNLMMLLLVVSLMGVFYFGREMRVLPKGQIIFSATKALLCISMALTYTLMHKGLWDVMDYCILGILALVVLIDVPRVWKASKKMKE